jgi:hypothetical protein
VPIGLGTGPVCGVCGRDARWLRRLTLRAPGGKPLCNRIWRCDTHATAAPYGSRGCPHTSGVCQACERADPLGQLDPDTAHHIDGPCPTTTKGSV